MTLLADRDERFKGLFVKVSIFVLLALVGVALNFLYAALRQGVFMHKTPIYFVAPSGDNIREGMAVKLSGFKIGTVESMVLNEMAQTRVEVQIDQRYMHFLKRDASVTVKREGVIGDNVLMVDRGSNDQAPLQANEEVRFVQSGGLEQITQDLRDQLFPAIKDISKLLHDVNDPNGDIRQILKNMRVLTASLNESRARLDRVLDTTNAAVAGDMSPMLKSLNKSSARLEQDLPGLLDKANATLDNLQQTTTKLKSTLEVAGPQLSNLVGEGRELVNGANKTVNSLNNNPLLRAGVPPEQNPELLKLDSGD